MDKSLPARTLAGVEGDEGRDGREGTGQQESTTGIALAFLSAAGFSALGLFAKMIYGAGFSVVQTLAWRFTFACTFLLVVCGFRFYSRHSRKRSVEQGFSEARYAKESLLSSFLGIPRKRLLPVMLLGIFGFTPQAGMFFLTVRLLDPGMAALLLYLYPSFVLLITAILWKKRPSALQLVALLLSLAGCALTFFKAGDYPLAGMLLAVAVAVAYGGYLVAGERVLAGVDAVGSTTLIMAVAAVLYWGAVLISGIPPRAPDSVLAFSGFLGVSLISTVLPIVTLFKAMERIGAANTSLVSTVEPVFTLILSALFFRERPGLTQLGGGLLILASVVVLRFASSAQRG